MFGLLQNYVDSIKLPDGIDFSNPDVEALAAWIINLTLTIYSASEIKNDFVLLHGVTSAWSLKQVKILQSLITARHSEGYGKVMFYRCLSVKREVTPWSLVPGPFPGPC